MKKNESAKALIFNGTGINYSWHLPRLFDLSLEEFKAFDKMIFISGASTALLVYWAMKQKLVTWTREDFLNWNKLSHKVYGSNLISGINRLIRLSTGSKKPIFSKENYTAAWAMGVVPEFFDVKLKDLPKNVEIPLVNRMTGEVAIASPDSPFGEYPAYLVSFAGTAIPKVFADTHLGETVYGDLTYSRKFLPWLKQTESGLPSFVNYNLIKSATLPNGEYVKICDHPNPKKMMQRDNIRFLCGLHIDSFPNNIRRSKL